ncbi:myosin-like coiled-coil protein-domain-containing protein [Macrophomina phaseolina]|uniref:Myosin-like coiled-coil protein-domain-containing protein n=1 Tax=Macrophomina phaseolina TaxID=35725 RepID=A0ABQ8GPJ6_9PEZI|nr:myosin-like coiled-coil protein-domain-containing protein [Macrophomina phaseolina]
MATSTAPPPAPAGPPPKKGKNKKGTDPRDASEQIAAKIAQLEQDAAGEKDQDVEIEREVKKANRELSQLLSQIESPMKKVEEVRKKYSALFADMKRAEREHVKAKKRADQLQKEKDSGKTDLNKMTTLKERLEKMSRDLTKENKKLKEENVQREATESRHREELHYRLERMVLDVEDVINSKENPEPQQVDTDLDRLFEEKFKSFLDQWECREKQFKSLLRVKELEILYHQAKLDQQRKAQEVESSKSNQLTRQVTTFSQTEAELRSQLNIYVEKFKQVEDTLNNSNDLFLTFRREMEEMSKKTKRLEKENLVLTRKQEATNKNILEMAEERTRTQQEMEKLRRKNENLEKLCRGMQAQGRGQVPPHELDPDDEGTESEYLDDDEYDEEGSEEYDEDTEEEAIDVRPGPEQPKVYGPAPPPPQTMANGKVNGKVNGQVNGVRKS